MGILDWLFGSNIDRAKDPQRSSEGAGRDPGAGRYTTKTERDLRRVQSRYDPETESFAPETPDPLEPAGIPGQNPATPERMPGHTRYYEDKR